MRLRIFAEAFDYNLRFLILTVPYDSYICIRNRARYRYRTARGPSGGVGRGGSVRAGGVRVRDEVIFNP